MVIPSESGLELRKRLRRRLLWKVPLIVALVYFAVWWQARQESEKLVNKRPPLVGIETREKWAGTWRGEAVFPERGKVVEQFIFQVEGDRLIGMASYFGTEYKIEDGRFDGDEISFYIRFAAPDGSERKVSYRGRFASDRIDLNLQDDRGGPPLELSLTKRGGTTAEGASRQSRKSELLVRL
jgi:hypothetical protein